MDKKEQELDLMIKIVTIGESGVGKTNLISRYVRNEFSENTTSTVGIDFTSKVLAINGSNVNLQIWDTAGQERMRAIASAYYREANGVLLVYDITDKETFSRIPFWLKEIRDNSNDRVKIIIVGNKADLLDDREVSLEEAKEFARLRDFYYMEVSAKTNMNNCVNVAFEELVKSVIASLRPEELTHLRNKSTIRKNFQSELESAKKKEPSLQGGKCCQYM
jgi:small GTP-binding protein